MYRSRDPHNPVDDEAVENYHSQGRMPSEYHENSQHQDIRRRRQVVSSACQACRRRKSKVRITNGTSGCPLSHDSAMEVLLRVKRVFRGKASVCSVPVPIKDEV